MSILRRRGPLGLSWRTILICSALVFFSSASESFGFPWVGLISGLISVLGFGVATYGSLSDLGKAVYDAFLVFYCWLCRAVLSVLEFFLDVIDPLLPDIDIPVDWGFGLKLFHLANLALPVTEVLFWVSMLVALRATIFVINLVWRALPWTG